MTPLYRQLEVTFITGLDKIEITKAKTIAPNESTAQGATVEIDADLLVLEDKKSTAVWTGNVRSRRGPTLIEIDMVAIGPFATAFAGPPVKKAANHA